MSITPAALSRGVEIVANLRELAGQIRNAPITDYYHQTASRMSARDLLQSTSHVAAKAADELGTLGFSAASVEEARWSARMLTSAVDQPISSDMLGVWAQKLENHSALILTKATNAPAAQAPISLAPARASYW